MSRFRRSLQSGRASCTYPTRNFATLGLHFVTPRAATEGLARFGPPALQVARWSDYSSPPGLNRGARRMV